MRERRSLAPASAQLLLAGILLLALALRIYHLGSLPFEQDELYTMRDARDFGESAVASGGPGIRGRPLYYLLQHALLALFPATPFLLRFPALIFGLLGVWVTWLVGRREFGTAAAAVAALLVAISPWHLYASQFARYWTLVYLLAALLYLLLPRAVATDRPRDYLLALLPLLAGALTHPTFLFPMVGVAVAVHAVSTEGRFRLPWPSRNAWKALWGPFLLSLGLGYLALKVTGSEEGLQNWGGRGVAATLRLLPAVVQWIEPAVVAAGLAGAIYLLGRDRVEDRRWGAMALFGVGGAILLLLLAALRTDVYADYGMSMLPLVFVTVGGAVQRLGSRLAAPTRFAVGTTAVLAAAVLPATVSHLLDGTRFDYRPAYRYIARTDPGGLVVGWPVVLQRYYAPRLRFDELKSSASFLEQNAAREPFWLVTSHHRHGMISGGAQVERWIGANCHKVLETGRTRLDYRSYRVDLHRCDRTPTSVTTLPPRR